MTDTEIVDVAASIDQSDYSMGILAYGYDHNVFTVSDVIDEKALKQSSTYSAARGLEQAGAIERVSDGKGSRPTLYRITDLGHKSVEWYRENLE